MPSSKCRNGAVSSGPFLIAWSCDSNSSASAGGRAAPAQAMLDEAVAHAGLGQQAVDTLSVVAFEDVSADRTEKGSTPAAICSQSSGEMSRSTTQYQSRARVGRSFSMSCAGMSLIEVAVVEVVRDRPCLQTRLTCRPRRRRLLRSHRQTPDRLPRKCWRPLALPHFAQYIAPEFNKPARHHRKTYVS
jgi:hypothetical protein